MPIRAPLNAFLAVGIVALAGAAPPDEVPWERLSPDVRREARAVADGATVQGEIPARRVRSEGRVYRTLLGELPLASRLLAALELGSYTIEPLPRDRFRIDDGSGAVAACQRALDAEGLLVVLARGELDVPVLPAIHGTGLIVVRYPPSPKGGLRCSAEVDFRLESELLRTLSRPLRGVLRRILTERLELLVSSATALAEAVSADPWAVYRRLQARGVDPADLRAYRELFLAV